jgi:hypothetical protein
MENEFVICPNCKTKNFATDKNCGICNKSLANAPIFENINKKALITNIANTKQKRLKQKNNIKIVNYLTASIIIISFLYLVFSKNENTQNNSYKQNASNKNLNEIDPLSDKNIIDLNSLIGQKFTFKSSINDKEFNGETIQTNHEISYHTFDFVGRTVTQKAQLNGKWLVSTFPMNDIYEEKGLYTSTYVIVVNQMGVKEIWFSFGGQNLGYDFDDGTRIECYGLSKIN